MYTFSKDNHKKAQQNNKAKEIVSSKENSQSSELLLVKLQISSSKGSNSLVTPRSDLYVSIAWATSASEWYDLALELYYSLINLTMNAHQNKNKNGAATFISSINKMLTTRWLRIYAAFV